MSRYSGFDRGGYGYDDDRGHSRGSRHRHSSHRSRRSRSPSESSYSRNVRQRRSYHDRRSRSPSPAFTSRYDDQYDSSWNAAPSYDSRGRRGRSPSPEWRSHGGGGDRRYGDSYYGYGYDDYRYDDQRRRSSRSRSRPRLHNEQSTRRGRRSHARDRARRSRSSERRGHDGGQRRHDDTHYGYDDRDARAQRPSRSRSRPRQRTEHVSRREREVSVVTRSSRSGSDQRPVALAPPPDEGQADAEWEGSTQPLETKSDDPYLCASVALSSRAGASGSGNAQRLKSNCYKVAVDAVKCPKIFQYHVAIEMGGEGEGDKQKFCGRPLMRPLLRQVMQSAIEQNQNLFGQILVVHDGANALFTAAALPLSSETEVLDVRSSARNGYGIDPPGVAKGKSRSFAVRIRLVKEIEVSSLQEAFTNPSVEIKPLVYALNAVMKAGLVGSRVECRGNLYSRMDALDMNGGRVLYKGHHQTVRLGAGSLVLNLDRVWREFYAEGPLLQIVGDALGSRHYDSIQLSDLQETFRLARALKKLVVRVTHRDTNLKEVMGVSESSARSTMINVDGNPVSVEQYFVDRYHIRLRYPNLPPVNLGGRKAGTESWVPIELCEVAPGQPYSGPDRSNTSTIRTQAVVKPHVRMNGIQRLRDSFNFENDPFLRAFGLSVAERMEGVGARVLAAPDIQYGNGVHRPRNGNWNLQDRTFVRPCTLSNWGVVICSSMKGSYPCVNRQAAERFIANLCREAVNRGIQVTNRNPAIVSSEDRPRGSLESWLTTCHDYLDGDKASRGEPQLIIVIKADDDAMEYQEIKRTMHSILGIPSQCITAGVLGRAKVQVLANLCLKINAKLGGRNAEFPEGTLPLMHDEPTILIGADVCYPKMDKGTRPPISSVTASLDRHSSMYAARLSVRSGHSDYSHLPQMLWELFIEHSRRQPKHVVYYRSGLSTSRVEDVVKAEMASLRKAFRMLAPDYEPRVTFVVANKHHHVRLFVGEGAGRNQSDRSGNPVPGTIVDSGTLADPQRLEFFLMGHSGIQGTSVPTQYTVMVDENSLSADQVEELTYRLCYSYARCTRSVSIVPPLYYAQLAAEHALGSLSDTSTDCSSTSSNMASTYTLAGLSDKLGGVMFFV